MNPIRIIYELDVAPGKEAQCERAWRQIVAAHSTHGALGSVFLRDEALAGRFLAISRWESLRAWEEGRRDDAHPEAYAAFRDASTVVSRRVLHELVCLEPA